MKPHLPPPVTRELEALPNNAAMVRRVWNDDSGDFETRMVRGPAVVCLAAEVQDDDPDEETSLGDECYVPLGMTPLAARCLECVQQEAPLTFPADL